MELLAGDLVKFKVREKEARDLFVLYQSYFSCPHSEINHTLYTWGCQVGRVQRFGRSSSRQAGKHMKSTMPLISVQHIADPFSRLMEPTLGLPLHAFMSIEAVLCGS